MDRDGGYPVVAPERRDSFRWETVVAGVCQVLLWAEVSLVFPLRSLPPGERWLRLGWAIPWLVLTPALAISAIRHRRANLVSRLLACGILVICLTSWPFWYAVTSFWWLFTNYPP